MKFFFLTIRLPAKLTPGFFPDLTFYFAIVKLFSCLLST
ncbi:Uncharacterized protein dnm_041930 [Desulfonema magnum]|uniref:Uncharacterized protein n=1 Tax=Desulfonema magnum TaxID=45655 RepID=A0A975GPQ6_9BACT|nr:Uncharacterized protein dnm_041930 [Desulfonema magnum]